MFVYRLQLLISFKVSKMILYCCLLCVLALLVTFVMLEDWLSPCLVPDLVCMCFVAVLYLNNAMNCSLHFSFCFRDLIALPSIWMRAHHIQNDMLKTLDLSILSVVLRRWSAFLTGGTRYVCLSFSGFKFLSSLVHDWCISLERSFDFRLCKNASFLIA